ncbi:CAP domain-containing protein [Nocardia takedensis]|uniref:CAP domain-containing protein n=1 Tax=Nocardia takedensis TaxID=259390 RepID=UPI0002EE4AF5|nr:CAP domain-containing protein [Nocardia takedensis]
MKKACAAITGVIAATLLSTVPAHADTWSDQVLTEHNTARADYGARPLTWAANLYPAALHHAQNCRYVASDAAGRYGENLYVSTNPDATIREALTAWMNEATRYDHEAPRYSRRTAHFTQVVWKATTQVTAAVADCPAGTLLPQATRFIVARYTPPGNTPGAFPQNVGRPLA